MAWKLLLAQTFWVVPAAAVAEIVNFGVFPSTLVQMIDSDDIGQPASGAAKVQVSVNSVNVGLLIDPTGVPIVGVLLRQGRGSWVPLHLAGRDACMGESKETDLERTFEAAEFTPLPAVLAAATAQV